MRKATNYEKWIVALCTLLARIECTADDGDVRTMCRQRFDIAKEHEATIEFSSMPVSGMEH